MNKTDWKEIINAAGENAVVLLILYFVLTWMFK